MSNLNEFLINRFKLLDRLLPYSSRPVRGRRPIRRSSPKRVLPSVPLELPTLEQALSRLIEAELPRSSALLGICEDGLPFLLDLTNPAAGSLLVFGDPASGKTALMETLLISATALNQPKQLTYRIIASQPDEYEHLVEAPHCQAFLPVEDGNLAGLINELDEIISTRKQRGPTDPAILLVIDDLPTLLQFVDETTYHRLYGLIRHGPRYRVWTAATLVGRQNEQIAPRFLTAFRSQLFGYMMNERLAQRLAQTDAITPRHLQKGSQFFVPYDGAWLCLSLCQPGGSKEVDDWDEVLPGGEK